MYISLCLLITILELIIITSYCNQMQNCDIILIEVLRYLCYIILRNVLQCYVTIKVTLVAKRDIYHVLFGFFIMYRKMEVMIIRQVNYISYSPLIRKSIIKKLQLLLLSMFK